MQWSCCSPPPRYAFRMARLGIAATVSFLLCVSAGLPTCAGHPAFLPVDPPIAFVQGDPGRTTFTLAMDRFGWAAALSRSVSGACDVVALVGPDRLFDLRARVRLPWTLFPVHVEFELGARCRSVLGSLSLGPMRLVATRAWGEDEHVRVAAYASSSRFIVAAGAEIGDQRRPFISGTWSPGRVPLWTLTLLAAPDGLRLTIGGTW
jgi:hypothetical protein